MYKHLLLQRLHNHFFRPTQYLLEKYDSTLVVIGYDSRIKSDVFARTAAAVFAANGIHVHIWPELNP